MLHLADVTLQQRDHVGVRKLPKFRVMRDISRPIFDDRIDPQLEIIGQVGGVCRDTSGEPHHLAPDRVERLTINLGHICHTIGAGHRIEVDLTSSNFPAAPATLTAAIRYWRITATPTSASPATPFTSPS